MGQRTGCGTPSEISRHGAEMTVRPVVRVVCLFGYGYE